MEQKVTLVRELLNGFPKNAPNSVASRLTLWLRGPIGPHGSLGASYCDLLAFEFRWSRLHQIQQRLRQIRALHAMTPFRRRLEAIVLGSRFCDLTSPEQS